MSSEPARLHPSPSPPRRDKESSSPPRPICVPGRPSVRTSCLPTSSSWERRRPVPPVSTAQKYVSLRPPGRLALVSFQVTRAQVTVYILDHDSRHSGAQTKWSPKLHYGLYDPRL